MGTGDNIRQYRKAAGMSRDDLAERLHMDEKDVALWERGIDEPEETLLYRIAELLGVSPDTLRKNASPTVKTEPAVNPELPKPEESDVALKLVTPLETSLRRGEKLIWAGKPARRKGLSALTQPQILLKLGGLVFELIFLFRFARLSPLLIVAACVLASAQLVVVLRKMRRTARLRDDTHYAITDERVIIRRAEANGGVQFMELKDIRGVQCDEGSGGIGSVVFLNEETAEANRLAPSIPLVKAFRYADSPDVPTYGFLDIADVEKVYDIIRNLLN